MAPIRLAVVATLSLSALAAVHAAELPSQARKEKPPESAQSQKKCNIGGMTGVVAANGVCVRLSGSVSAGFSGRQIR